MVPKDARKRRDIQCHYGQHGWMVPKGLHASAVTYNVITNSMAGWCRMMHASANGNPHATWPVHGPYHLALDPCHMALSTDRHLALSTDPCHMAI